LLARLAQAIPSVLTRQRVRWTITLTNSSRACTPASSLHSNGTPRRLAHIHGREPAGRAAIETATKEDTEMARTRKTDESTENIVPLRPDDEEQAPVGDQPGEPVQPDSDEQAEPAEASEQQPRRRGTGPSLNRVELIGRIAREPDVRATHTGMHLAYFRVATNGREDKDTEFHQCTAFGKTAEFIGDYLGLGRLVWVEGRLQTRQYDDSDGVRRWVTTIVVNRLQALDQRRPAEQ
jgi:single-strand DNA-binding protein